MANERGRLWNSKKRDSYMQSVRQANERAIAEREGYFVARSIEQSWETLSKDERQLLDYLLLLDAPSCVGQCEDVLLTQLVEKGFLQFPLGVRLVLLQDLETVFSMPMAVWTALKSHRSNRLKVEKETLQRMKDEGETLFGERIKPIVAVSR
jgi:hypothetical protein